MALTIPLSRINQFYRKGWPKNLRMGQAFHTEMQLDKVTGEDKDLCDKIYNAKQDEAKKLIESITDWEN